MSDALTGGDRGDDGFSLIEVIVALGIFLVVMMAVLPQILTAVRGTARAAQQTESKGVIEAQFELMRNLPWHVAPNAGNRIDVLDRYYPDLQPRGAASATADACLGLPDEGWTGYVVTAATRCSYEPPSGSFYRTVERVDPPGSGEYLLVTDAQFLDSVDPPGAQDYGPTPAVQPAGGYDSTGHAGSDVPISQQLAVTVTAFDLRRPTPQPMSDYTQIAEDVRSPQRVQAVAAATAIEVRGIHRQDGQERSITARAGIVDMKDSLARMSSATGRVVAVESRWSADDPEVAAPVSAFAPPTATGPSVSAAAGDLAASGACSYVCWGRSVTSAVPASADSGLPSVASTTTPAQAAVDDPAAPALTFGNAPAAERASSDRPQLDLVPTQPLLTVEGTSSSLSGCGGIGIGEILGRGYAVTTATTVASCAETGTTAVSLFPTTGHPGGILRLNLTYARAVCSSSAGGARTATPAFSVGVTVVGIAGTVTKTFTQAATPAERTAFQNLLSLQVTSSGGTLGDYVHDWALGTATSSTSEPAVGSSVPAASASVPAALTLTSTPIRTSPGDGSTPDPTSDFSVRLGAASCETLDAR